MDLDKASQEICRLMLPYLDAGQSKKLRRVLSHCLFDEKSLAGCGEQASDNSYVDNFIDAKRLEGCSERTLSYYASTLEKLVSSSDVPICERDTEDIRSYLATYQKRVGISKTTVDNIRRIISSFYSWLEDEDLVLKSPVRRIKKVKAPVTIKEVYSEETIEILRENCGSMRNLALIDLLRSTGMRVGELVSLNRSAIDTTRMECVVRGKGDKERVVYFDAKTKLHIEQYLDTRDDSNDALFVAHKYPHNRLQVGGVEALLRKLGRDLGVGRVHPHKFRRTLATRAIDKGMPIEQVQVLLGHKKIDTTLRYALVDQRNVKASHRRYLT